MLRLDQQCDPAMGQLLFMLIVPPLVGVVTYAIFRIIFAGDVDKNGDAISQRRFDAR
jgi:hypothetical protein